MPAAHSIPLALAALLSLAFGVRYLRTREFMPYHAVVCGKSWSELDEGVRTIIIGILRIVGGGLAAYGLALLWLLIPLQRGETWAAWAALTTSVAALVPALYVTFALRRYRPGAPTPVAPAIAALALALLGVVLWFATR